MSRAMFVRSQEQAVADEQFIQAWTPTDLTTGSCPSAVTVNNNMTNDRQIIWVLEIDAAAYELTDVLASLIHPDSASRPTEVVESTQLEAMLEDTSTVGSGNLLESGSWLKAHRAIVKSQQGRFQLTMSSTGGLLAGDRLLK